MSVDNKAVGGCIITDVSGNVIFANEIIKQLSGMGKIDHIDSVKELLESNNPVCIKTQEHRIYWINDNENDFISKTLESSFDEIFICDKHGRAIYCNKTFEKHYGITCSEMMGKYIWEFVDDGVVDRTLLRDVIEQKVPMTYEQTTRVGKTILNTTTPVLDENDEILFIVENCRDITEINKLKQDLYDTSKKLMNAQKNLDMRYGDNYKEDIEFTSAKMQEVNNLVDNMAKKDVTMLVLGKSGTGKSMLAKRIHAMSNRFEKPFISINCSTIPENLMESELFGYEKGAFTGASDKGKKGLVENADGGTLFLDEIGEIPMSVQAKLLEFIQEKTFVPVGGTRSKKIDVRIIAATNQNLPDMIEKKLFREDLYYRLSVITVNIPSLSERPEDISLLLDHYMEYFNCKHSVNVNMTEAARRSLERYSYPGNIRELEHLVEFLILNSEKEKIQLSDLPTNVLDHNDLKSIINDDMSNENLTLKEMLSLEEGRIVRRAYQNYGSSYKVAEKLGISQSTAHRLINKYCKQ